MCACHIVSVLKLIIWWKQLSMNSFSIQTGKRNVNPSKNFTIMQWMFTVQCLSSIVYAMALCLSVCLSQFGVVRVLSKWLNIMSHDSAGTLLYWRQRSGWNSPPNAPNGGAKCTWVGTIWSVMSMAWVRRPAARRIHWTFDVKTAGCDGYFRQ